MKSIKKLVASLSAAVMALGAAGIMPASAEEKFPNKYEIVKAMGAGWNLGNSLDVTSTSLDAEEYWGNPKTTKEMIDFVRDQGFSTVRIPVTWGYHMDENHRIDPQYMARVKEVVDYAYEDGLYVIINIHHDNDIPKKDKDKQARQENYFYPDNDHKSISKTFVTSVWSQVSAEFKDYDEHLIFETLNEPRLIGDTNEWWFNASSPQAKVKTAISIINDLNQTAVDTIRASGGNNAKRLIMCPGYDASLDGATTPYYKLPTDKADMVAVSVHAYSPYSFAMDKDGTRVYDESTQRELKSIFKTIKSKLIDNGQAVVIGEFGATNKENSAERAKWAQDFTNLAAEMGASYCLWDNNAFITSWDSAYNEKFGLIHRKELTVDDQTYLNGLLKAQKNGATHTFDEGVVTKAATLTSAGVKTYTCLGCGETKTETIPKLVDISKLTVKLESTSMPYTGSAVKPKVTIKNGSKALVSGTDFAVASYKNNTAVGTATVVVKGRGAYGGEKTLTFKIVKANVKNAEITGIKNKYYTGKAVKQSIVVKSSGKTLKEGTDYTLTYKSNKAIGKATVTIKGKGNYTGTVTKAFKICPKKTTLKTATSPKKGAIKVTYTKQTKITGYQVTYANNSAFKNAASKNSGKLTKTVTGLKKGTYYVKVRTYKTVKGVKYYSGYSAVKKVVVK